MIHDCKEMPNSVEITFNQYSDRWLLTTQFDCYSDKREVNHIALINTLLNINYCPYCGKELK